MQRNNEMVIQGDDRVEPVFRLLGEGRLTPAEVDALTAMLMAAGLPAVPEAWLMRARQIARGTGRGVLTRLPGGWAATPRVLSAMLMAEQRPWLAAVGVRGGSAGICRLMFAVDAYEIVIQDTSRSYQKGHDLSGQVMRDGEPVPSAGIVLAGGSQPAETEADGDGSFRFGAVAAGRYDLEVWAEDDLIVCSPLVLSTAPGDS